MVNQDLVERLKSMPEVNTFADIDEAIQYLIDHREEFPRRDDKEETLSLGYLVISAKWADKVNLKQQQTLQRQASAADYALSIKEPLEGLIREVYNHREDDVDARGFSKRLFSRLDPTLFANKKTLNKTITEEVFLGLNDRIKPYCERENNNYKLSIDIVQWFDLERQDRETLINDNGVRILSESYLRVIRKYAMLAYGNKVVNDKLMEV